MKVLIYSNPHLADCDVPLVREFQSKGIDVTYLLELNSVGSNGTIINIPNGKKFNGILPWKDFPELRTFGSYMNLDNCYVSNSYKKHKFPKIDRLILSLKVYAFLKHGKFDVIQRTQVFFFSDIILYRFRKRMIKMVHDPFLHSGDHMSFRVRYFYNLGMRLFPRFVILNENQYDRFCQEYKKDPSRVLLNKLGIYDYYQRLGVECRTIENNILFFGRISKYKGLKYLCEAMTRVHEKVPDATLTIAGSGNFDFDVSLYKQRPYFDIKNVFISSSELATMLRQCEFVVCPYTDATQSGVVMTAFAFSKPVIASSVGGLKEQIEDGMSGILVEPKDVDTLAETMIDLLTNTKKVQEMSKYIERNFISGDKSWGKIADNYIDFYKKI